ncbi:hypothetical protein EH220_03905 [bacterium]|nr:MAG: hypothetical protein EH220_03905 [bacterium]
MKRNEVRTWIAGLALVLGLAVGQAGYAQGCSDAGLCTIPGVNTVAPQASRNTLKLGLSQGAGEEGVSIISAFASWERKFSQRFGVHGKVTFLSSNGDLGNAAGLGDLFVSGSYRAATFESGELMLTGGVKLPLSQPDADADGNDLPMAYQVSQGTTDLLLGVLYTKSSFGVSFGFQQPLVQTEKNDFIPGAYFGSDYPIARELKRQGDLLARIFVTTHLEEQLRFQPGLLAIYHIAEDKFTDVNGVEREFDGSAGLTLNLNLLAAYQLSQHNELELTLGFPLATRDVRPDGLTRSYVVGLEFSWGL